MLTREFYIKPEAAKIEDQGSDAVAYTWERDTATGTRYIVMAFHGRAQKPDFHFYYRTAEERAAKVAKHFAGWAARKQAKVARKADKAAWQNPYKAGDMFRTCWGYDQTNVEWFEVVDVRGKHLIIREVAQEREGTLRDQGVCVPVPGKYIGDPIRCLAQQGSIRIDRVRRGFFEEPQHVIGGKPVFHPASWTAYA